MRMGTRTISLAPSPGTLVRFPLRGTGFQPVSPVTPKHRHRRRPELTHPNESRAETDSILNWISGRANVQEARATKWYPRSELHRHWSVSETDASAIGLRGRLEKVLPEGFAPSAFPFEADGSSSELREWIENGSPRWICTINLLIQNQTFH